MEPKRPQLKLDELHRLKWLLGGALVLLSVSTVLYLDIPAWFLMTLTIGGVGAVMIKPAWPARVPALVHRLAFPFIVAVFIGDIYLTTEVLPALVRLDLLLLFYRGVTYRQRRDDLQIIVLGLFLIVLAGVLTVSLLFAVQILAFSACALAFLLIITLVHASDPRPAPLVPAMEPAWTRITVRALLRRVRVATDWRIALLGGGLFGGLVVLSAVLFMAIPRFELQNSLFLERFISKKSRTGFSDRIKFGDVTDIQQDRSVAVSIDLSDPSRIPAQPYWRMVVLDEYQDETFRLSPALQRDEFSRDLSRASLRGRARAQLGTPVYWTFYMESGVSRYLPLAGQFEQLWFRDRQNFRNAPDLGIVALKDEPVSMTAYRVEGMLTGAQLPDPKFAQAWAARHESENNSAQAQTKLSLNPADLERLKQITQSITGGEKLNVAEFARRTSAWLARQHQYGLRSRTPAGAGDALVRWMLSTEPGHCELFAGSMVLLARAVDIPARVVTGFRGGSWNGYSNNFTLRNSDAHAWTELYDFHSESWLRVDPTPGAPVTGADATALSALQTREVDRSWSARLDSLRIFWYRRIVNFDQRSQVETIKAVKTATEETGRRIREWFQVQLTRLKAWLATPWNAGRLLNGLLAVALLGGAGWGIVFLWRRLRPLSWRNRRGRLHPNRLEAGKWLRLLKGKSSDAALLEALARLRYGPQTAGGDATGVFRQARSEWGRVRRRPVSSP
jgi:protein-glutamine gamma-glutamyltransferase